MKILRDPGSTVKVLVDLVAEVRAEGETAG
jgi:hypothetical protein